MWIDILQVTGQPAAAAAGVADQVIAEAGDSADTIRYSARCPGGISRDNGILDCNSSCRRVGDSTASLACWTKTVCRVPGNRAVFDRQRRVVVDAAGLVSHVSRNRAVGDGQRARLVIDPATSAILWARRIAGNSAVLDGQ